TQDVAANLEAVDGRADATELEATQTAETARVEALELRRVRSRIAQLRVKRQDVPPGAVGALEDGPVLVEISIEDREREIARCLLHRQVEDVARRRPQVGVAAVAGGAQPQRGQEVVSLHAGVVRRGTGPDGLAVHVLDAHCRGQRPVLAEAPPQRDAAPQPALAVLVELPRVVVAADRQTVRAVEQERLTELNGVPLQLRTRHGLDPQLLPGAAEGL